MTLYFDYCEYVYVIDACVVGKISVRCSKYTTSDYFLHVYD